MPLCKLNKKLLHALVDSIVQDWVRKSGLQDRIIPVEAIFATMSCQPKKGGACSPAIIMMMITHDPLACKLPVLLDQTDATCNFDFQIPTRLSQT
jgi:hypothetical protein